MIGCPGVILKPFGSSQSLSSLLSNVVWTMHFIFELPFGVETRSPLISVDTGFLDPLAIMIKLSPVKHPPPQLQLL